MNFHKRPSWDETFLLSAILAASRSSCLKRAVGAALVRDKRIVATGYNGAAPGIENCIQKRHCYYEAIAWEDYRNGHGSFELLREQRKNLCIAVHAEANALNQCSKLGIAAEGAVLYITNFPCPGCVQNEIIPNGIAMVKVWKGYIENPLITMDERRASEKLLEEADIPFEFVNLTRERLAEIFGIMSRVGDRTEYRFNPPDSPSLFE